MPGMPRFKPAMKIVYAKQPFPESWTSALFLAGPTPRDTETPSWRPEALRLLEVAGYDGVVMVPEVKHGEWASGPDAYMEQVEWERRGLELADVILFWIPRDMASMPGLTTNVELGLYASSGKCVMGAPPWAKSIKYLEHVMDSVGTPGRPETLEATVEAALARVEKLTEGLPTFRTGGERCVPLHIWTLPSYQAWYGAQTQAGNRLDDAKLLWHFKMPKMKAVFAWVVWVKVWIEAEGRYKENEWVLSRSDISTVVLYARQDDDAHAEDYELDLLDTEIVIVREFRSPARTPDGTIREIAGGSSLKPGQDPLKVACDEVHEETGIILSPQRLRKIGSRQVAGTLSAHHAVCYAAELSPEEMSQAKALAGQTFGVEEDTERTTVEVTSVRDLLKGDSGVDWSNLGMILGALLGS